MNSLRCPVAFASLVMMLLSGRTTAEDSVQPEDCDLPSLWQSVFVDSGTGQEGGTVENGLSNLQITVEVRFVTLNDNFFEEIGVDFDFDINDASSFPVGPTVNNTGMNPDFDSPIHSNLPVPNNPFQGPSIPVIGEPGATAFGAAVLSDIEMYYLLQALQSDRRTHIVTAPKVTLYNGQAANIAEPRTGLGRLLPVSQVIPDGKLLSVQGVISADRRYLRLNVMPVVNPIGDVNVFNNVFSFFRRSRYMRLPKPPGGLQNPPPIQLAKKFATVVLEDGQTIALGGVKRLRNGQNEGGIPILNNIPYLGRLFRNAGVSRDTRSLLIFVTPRIIIQEEEEED